MPSQPIQYEVESLPESPGPRGKSLIVFGIVATQVLFTFKSVTLIRQAAREASQGKDTGHPTWQILPWIAALLATYAVAGIWLFRKHRRQRSEPD